MHNKRNKIVNSLVLLNLPGNKLSLINKLKLEINIKILNNKNIILNKKSKKCNNKYLSIPELHWLKLKYKPLNKKLSSNSANLSLKVLKRKLPKPNRINNFPVSNKTLNNTWVPEMEPLQMQLLWLIALLLIKVLWQGQLTWWESILKILLCLNFKINQPLYLKMPIMLFSNKINKNYKKWPINKLYNTSKLILNLMKLK